MHLTHAGLHTSPDLESSLLDGRHTAQWSRACSNLLAQKDYPGSGQAVQAPLHMLCIIDIQAVLERLHPAPAGPALTRHDAHQLPWPRLV